MPQRPRILQISNQYLQPGGEEQSVERIARNVSSLADLERCRFDSRQWTGARAPSLARQAQWMLNNPRSIAILKEIDARFRPDVWLIHNVFPIASAEVYCLAHRLGRPVIQYLHNYRPLSVSGYSWVHGRVAKGGILHTHLAEVLHGEWQGSRVRSAWYSFVLWRMRASAGYRSISAWVGVSDFVRSRFVEAGFPEDRVYAIRHSWDIRNESLSDYHDRGYYLFLGRLVEQKGIHILLRTWALLEERLGEATPELKICGEGPLEAVVRAACERSRKLTFCGHVSGREKDDLFRHARALVAPSLWWEPLGLIAYEAYDFGKPVLAANSGGLGELIFHNATGYLHDPGDCRELAQHVMTLDANRSLRASMGRAGRSWLLRNTGSQEWREQFQRVLQRVLGLPRSSTDKWTNPSPVLP